MCRPCGGTLAVSGSNIESVKCVTQLFVIGSWEVHTQATIAPLDAGTCPVVALCVLRPASARGCPPPPESNGILDFGCQISRNLLWYEEVSIQHGLYAS